MMKKLLSAFFRLAALSADIPGRVVVVPGGIVADPFGAWGLFGFMDADNILRGTYLRVVTANGSITLTAQQMLSGIINLVGNGGGAGYNVTTPTAAAIIALMGDNVPQDGSASFLGFLQNDGTGQTATLVGGTGVTVVNTATVATNANRHFLLNANANTGLVTIVTLGGHAI